MLTTRILKEKKVSMIGEIFLLKLVKSASNFPIKSVSWKQRLYVELKVNIFN